MPKIGCAQGGGGHCRGGIVVIQEDCGRHTSSRNNLEVGDKINESEPQEVEG